MWAGESKKNLGQIVEERSLESDTHCGGAGADPVLSLDGLAAG